MDMTGQQRIAVAQGEVWRALNDPEVIKACVPGCESIEQKSADEYHLTVTASVGPIKAKFKGKMKFSDVNPPDSYSLSFEGQGGAAGFGKGSASVRLSPDGSGTLLEYSANASVGGKLAQIGSRMIDTAARKIADEFFANFNARVAPAAMEAKDEAAVAGAVKAPAQLPALFWVAAAAVIIAAVYLLSR